jgi:hydroxypyruvate isomerase
VTRDLTRRQALGALGGLAAGAALAPHTAFGESRDGMRASRLRQSVSRWCYAKIPLDDLCEAAKSIGYKSVELLSEPEWPVVKQHGLDCAMANGFGQIPVGPAFRTSSCSAAIGQACPTARASPIASPGSSA